jgi:hydrogenase maturation factor
MMLRSGKAGENVLDRSVFKRIHAVYNKGEQVTMSADPVTLAVSAIGEYAVYAAVNALSAEKILPVSFRPVILLPPGTEESRLREIMDQISRACASQELVIEGGHTEITSAVTRPVVTGCCTGVPMAGNCTEEPESPCARQIVMTKWAGMEGSCILAQEREDLQKVFPETLLHRMRSLGGLLSVKKEAVICAEEGTHYLTDLSEGGFYAALWRLSKKAQRGLRVDLKSVPVLQEMIEIANYFDIEPYRMRSAGSLLAVTDDAERLTARLAESGIYAVRIGELSPDPKDHDKILTNGEEIRYLDLPQPDELLKIM